MTIKNSRVGWIGALVLAVAAGASGIALLESEGELDVAADDSANQAPQRERRSVSNLDESIKYSLPATDGDAVRVAAELAVRKQAARDRVAKLECSGDGVAYAEFAGEDSPFLDRYVGAEVEPGVFISSFEGSLSAHNFLVCVEPSSMEGIAVADFENAGIAVPEFSGGRVVVNTSLEGIQVPLPVLTAGSSFGGYMAGGGLAAASTAALIELRTSEDPPISR